MLAKLPNSGGNLFPKEVGLVCSIHGNFAQSIGELKDRITPQVNFFQ